MAGESSAVLQRNHAASRLAVAVLVNLAMGSIYAWGVLLLPLEAATGRSRADLSLVPAMALVGFTVGMVVQDALIRRFGQITVAVVAFSLAGGGHLLYALVPTYETLLLGYGVAFGVGCGIGYGLALALASSVGDAGRSLAVGVTMAAFATSGILLPAIFATSIATAPPQRTFAAIGIAMLVVAAVVLLLSWRRPALKPAGAVSADVDASWRSPELVALGLTFFLICFVGLTLVAHGAGIASASGLPSGTVEQIPTTFMLGYLVGSLFGGKLVELLTGGAALIATSVLAGVGVSLIGVNAPVAALVGALAVGVTFGSSTSLMPTLIAERYGPTSIGPIYSKLMIAYGLAGLLAPWTAGLLFTATGSYRLTIAIGIAMCVLSAGLGYFLRRRPGRAGLPGGLSAPADPVSRSGRPVG